MTTDLAFTAGWAACREAAAKVADGIMGEMQSARDAAYQRGNDRAMDRCDARWWTARDIAAAIRAMPAPTPADAQPGGDAVKVAARLAVAEKAIATTRRKYDDDNLTKPLAIIRAVKREIAALLTQREPPADAQERRQGHSKLVYDKEKRTIVAVDPHPPADDA